MSKETRMVLLALSESKNGSAYIAIAETIGTNTLKKAIRRARRHKRRE